MGLTQVSKDGVKNDAIDASKLPANSVGASELADNAVDTNAIADQAVALSKLPHGDGSSNGKFLRANNGADPSFESIPAGTTINNNADNRVITGSGTANTLNGESLVTIDSSGRLSVEPSAGGSGITLASQGSTYGGIVKLRNTAGSNHDWIIGVGGGDGAYVAGRGLLIRDETTGANRIAIDTSGNVGIGTTTPQGGGLTVENSSEARVQVRAGSNGSNGILALRADGSNTQLGTWSNHDLKIVRNNSIKASFTSDGLCFNSDTAAANALDDYEEGTWTPTLTNVYAAGTSSGRVCVYRKIGQMVFITFDIFASASNMDINTSGDTVIGGLPFTTPANFNTTFQVAIYMNNASGQQMANYVNTGPQIVLHGSSRINNVRHLWGFGCYPAS